MMRFADGLVVLIAVATIPIAVTSASAEWKPAEAPLMTRWAKEVTPQTAHPEYPRPQMVRARWQNLNGLWQYAIRPGQESRPRDFEGEILVPYPVESALSGVMKRVAPDQ